MRIVIDASVLVKWYVPEIHSGEAEFESLSRQRKNHPPDGSRLDLHGACYFAWSGIRYRRQKVFPCRPRNFL